MCFNPVEVRCHNCEGFFFSMFSGSQRADRFIIAGIRHQMKSPEALDGEDATVTNGPDGVAHRLVVRGEKRARRIPEFDVRPAHGQAFGCAWNLRSPGFWYSAAQAPHMVKRAMVVFGRSYGKDWMIEKRGPQLVQLVNG